MCWIRLSHYSRLSVTFLLYLFLNSDLLKIGESNESNSAPSSLFFKSTKNSYLIMDTLQTDREKHKQASPQKQVRLVDGEVIYDVNYL